MWGKEKRSGKLTAVVSLDMAEGLCCVVEFRNICKVLDFKSI